MTQRYVLTPASSGDPVVLHDDSGRAVSPASGPGAVDDFGCTWAAEYPAGWDSLDFRTPVTESPGVDGGLIGPQSIGIRTVTVSGQVICPNRASARRATIRLRNALPLRSTVQLEVTDDDGSVLYVTGVPVATVEIIPVAGAGLTYSFGITCTDPYKRGAALQSLSAGLAREGVEGGLVLPPTGLVLPTDGLVLAGSEPQGGQLRPFNAGDAYSPPLITIDGPVWDPIVRNNTTGQYAQWSVVLSTGQQMVVDFATGLTTIDGQRAAVPIAGYAAQPWALPPGFSDVQFISRDIFNPAAGITLAWRDLYR